MSNPCPCLVALQSLAWLPAHAGASAPRVRGGRDPHAPCKGHSLPTGMHELTLLAKEAHRGTAGSVQGATIWTRQKAPPHFNRLSEEG